MPLVQHNQLPSIDRLSNEGVSVVLQANVDPDLPKLQVGFLNMMPDKALAATERQFLRLLAANENINCYLYPFTISGIERSQEAQQHFDRYYSNFETIQSIGLNALIITGANVTQPKLVHEPFWPQLEQVLLWAHKEVRSTFCSCLATHAAAKVFYGIDRQHLGKKCWGVFEHEVLAPDHVLVHKIQGSFPMCHSRFNDVSATALQENNIEIIVGSKEAGVQLAVDSEIRMLFFQGHPEYDDISLLKEYKREVVRFINGQREDYPPVPAGYFSKSALQVEKEYKQFVLSADNREDALAKFPESELQNQLTNQWRQVSLQIFRNWLQILV